MRTLASIGIGITIAWAAAAIWKPTIRWAFNDQPATPDDWAPRHRTWQNGIEQ